MLHASSKVLGNGFPFPIGYRDLSGNDYTAWDGETYYEKPGGGGRKYPSASDSEYIPCVGTGTERPLGFSLGALAHLHYVLGTVKASWSISGSEYRRFSEGSPNSYQREVKQEWSSAATNYRDIATFPPDSGYVGAIGELDLFRNKRHEKKLPVAVAPNYDVDSESHDAGTITIDRNRTKDGTWGDWEDTEFETLPYPSVTPIFGAPGFYFSMLFGEVGLSPMVVPFTLKVGSLYYPILEVLSMGFLSSTRTQADVGFDTPDFREAAVSDVTCSVFGQSVTLYDSFLTTLEGQADWVPADEDGYMEILDYSLTGSITVDRLDHWEWGGRFSATTGAVV